MEWYGDEYLAEVEQEIGRRVEQASDEFADSVQLNIGIQGTPKDRSKPGEFPRRQSGGTQGSIESTFNAEEITSYIGSSYAVARFLELKSSKGARPFLVRSLREQQSTIIQSILGSRFSAASISIT